MGRRDRAVRWLIAALLLLIPAQAWAVCNYPTKWPNASNTGYAQAGGNPLAQAANHCASAPGGYGNNGTLNVPGTYDQCNFSGTLTIQSGNVTVSRSNVNAGCGFHSVYISDASWDNIIIEDTTIDSQCDNTSSNSGVFTANSGTAPVNSIGTMLLRDDILHGGDGMSYGAKSKVLVQDTYFHDFQALSICPGTQCTHFNGIQNNGSGLTGIFLDVIHDWINQNGGQPGVTDAIMVSNDFPPVGNEHLIGTYLNSGNFDAYAAGTLPLTYSNNLLDNTAPGFNGYLYGSSINPSLLWTCNAAYTGHAAITPGGTSPATNTLVLGSVTATAPGGSSTITIPYTGTATGTITADVDCDNNGTYETIVSGSSSPLTATCTGASAGNTVPVMIWSTNSQADFGSVTYSGSCGATTPVAAFLCTPTTIITGATTTCTDASSNTPTSWLWSSGCTITSGQGTATATLTCTGSGTQKSVTDAATNCAGTGTTTRTNYITVTQAPALQFSGLPLAPAPVPVGSSISPATFLVCNIGGGLATGTVTISPSSPQSISPGTFTNLGANQCSTQTITYSTAGLTAVGSPYNYAINAQGSGLTTIMSNPGTAVVIQTAPALSITQGATQTLTALQGNSPGAFSFTIQNTGQATLTSNIVCTAANVGYYSANPVTTITQPIAGGVSTIVSVSPTMTGLTSAGSPYSDTITCAASGVSSVTVGVTITITAAGTAPDYTMAAVLGGRTLVQGQVATGLFVAQLHASTAGSSQISLKITSSPSWLTFTSFSAGSGTCSAGVCTDNFTSAGSFQNILATIDTTSLAVGTYPVTFTAVDNGSCLDTAGAATTCPTHTVTYKVVVTAPPQIGVSNLPSFALPQNSQPPAPITALVCNNGTGTLNASAQSTDASTTLTPSTVSGLTQGQCATVVMSFNQNWAFQAPGTYFVSILLNDNGSTPVAASPINAATSTAGTLSPAPSGLPR